ncbi:MAG: hypothetical protein IKR81_10855 [Victivallales bacterium]|nr:hypothetical protein [Victivallales bacterium]
MRDKDEKKEMYLKGHLEESEELCDDGTQALVIVTDDGDEYYIKNKKKIRRLQKYAFYDDIQIEFHGVLKYDLEGLPVFSIISYTPPKDNVVAQDEASYAEEERKVSKRKRKVVDEDEDEDADVELDDVDFNDTDEDFSDENDDFDADEEFDESDESDDDR